MSSSEDLEALRIHGHVFDSDSISDGGKSEFDDDYYALKPPPIVINNRRYIVVSIPPRTAPVTQDSTVERKVKLNPGEHVEKSIDSNTLLTKNSTANMPQVRTINPKLNVKQFSEFTKKSNKNLAATNVTPVAHTRSTNVPPLYKGESNCISNCLQPSFNEIMVPTGVTQDVSAKINASPKLKAYTKNDEILASTNVTPVPHKESANPNLQNKMNSDEILSENNCSSLDQISHLQPPPRTKRKNLRSQGNEISQQFSNVRVSSNATHRNISNVLPVTNEQTQIVNNMYSSTDALTGSERSNRWFDTVLSYLCCK